MRRVVDGSQILCIPHEKSTYLFSFPLSLAKAGPVGIHSLFTKGEGSTRRNLMKRIN